MPGPNTQSSSAARASLYFAMLLLGTGHTLVLAVFPMLGRELQLDQLAIPLLFSDQLWYPKELAITALSAASALVFFFGAPYWGRRSDHEGRRKTLLRGLVGYGIGTLLFCIAAYLGLIGLVKGLALYFFLLVLRSAQVFIMSAVQPVASAYVVDTATLAHRTRDMSRVAAASQLGTMLGPALAWFTAISFLAPFYVQALLIFIGAFITWRLLHEPTHIDRYAPKPAKLRYTDPRFRSLLFFQFLFFTLLAMVQQTLGFYFQDKLGTTSIAAAQNYAVAMVYAALATLFVQLAIVQHLKGSPLRLLRIGLPFTLASFLLLAVADSLPLLYLAMGLLGFGIGLVGPGIGVTVTYAVSSQEQGGLAGLMAAVGGMGFVAGPLIGGYIYRFDIAYPAWSAAILLIPMLIAALRLRDPQTHH